ncbi:MAG: PAS domain-containing protein [Methylococcales bacterium]|nr:MAG: PAS domain-containing protein [Methylococcales bacterium]
MPAQINPKKPATGFPIVGIGASAGGLEALQQFFRNFPVDSGLSFVVVSHLDPTHPSMLAEILQRATIMPVVEAVDELKIAPNHVYIIPPNRVMIISRGCLQLSMPEEPQGLRMPIDSFLRSLADDQQNLAVGIILSGTGTDGVLGLQAIQGVGGITVAQEPTDAKFDGMPTHAIQAGYVTHILPVEKMSALLSPFARTLIAPVKPQPVSKVISGINGVLNQLLTVTGNDFSRYKKSTIGRRIERRMVQHNIENIELYTRYLKENTSEAHLLFKELLINVTNFFRDPEAFEVLEKNILPSLCNDKPDDYVFRVWVAGCATGEEAYSIAILLSELLEVTHQVFKIQIYSTDLDDDVINIARAGIYPLTITQYVNPERLRRFFIKEETGYRVKKQLREMVIFAIQNVLKDPPFTKLDLISCRNLMIYLEPEAQNQLIPAFHYALKPGGILFLSPSEGICNHTDLFVALNRQWKFYRAKHDFVRSGTLLTNPTGRALVHTSKPPAVVKTQSVSYAELAHQMLLQCFAPAAIITDTLGNILYLHGDTEKYLRHVTGLASLNALDMACEGLYLHAAIRSAASKGKPTLNREMQVKTNTGITTVSVSVRPLSDPDGGQCLLISFQDIANPATDPLLKRITKPYQLERIEELEHDLAYLTEGYQSSVDELKSTNEEMQSTNEEIQSTNEELETSKEEMQSVNEELMTVNSELQAKIEQLIGLQNDMKNLLDNIKVGIIILDQHLLIRSFTPEAKHIYPLVTTDVGRPLSDFKSSVASIDLLAAAQTVFDSLTPFERELKLNNNIWMSVRIQPYRTLENRIDGVVLTFTDISASVKGVATQAALNLADGIVNSILEPILVLDEALKVVFANQTFYQYFKVRPEETLGKPVYEFGNGEWNLPELRELFGEVVSKGLPFNDFLVAQPVARQESPMLLMNARPLINNDSPLQLILLSIKLNT